MRQDLVCDSPAHRHYRQVWGLLASQAIFVIGVALIGLFFKGLHSALAIGAGGATSIIPGLLFSLGLFTMMNVMGPKQLAIVFCLGGFIKFICSGVLIALLIIRFPQEMGWILLGFASAFIGLWLAPWVAPQVINFRTGKV